MGMLKDYQKKKELWIFNIKKKLLKDYNEDLKAEKKYRQKL